LAQFCAQPRRGLFYLLLRFGHDLLGVQDPAEDQELVGRLLGSVRDPLTDLAASIALSHHERWDGDGYPDGRFGEEIPIGARIIFVADAYDAMTSDRVYRARLSEEDALAELERCAGTQFDPEVVAALVTVIEEGRPRVPTSDHVRALLVSSKVPQGAPSTP
jgi:hypothetical protein